MSLRRLNELWRWVEGSWKVSASEDEYRLTLAEACVLLKKLNRVKGGGKVYTLPMIEESGWMIFNDDLTIWIIDWGVEEWRRAGEDWTRHKAEDALMNQRLEMNDLRSSDQVIELNISKWTERSKMKVGLKVSVSAGQNNSAGNWLSTVPTQISQPQCQERCSRRCSLFCLTLKLSSHMKYS